MRLRWPPGAGTGQADEGGHHTRGALRTHPRRGIRFEQSTGRGWRRVAAPRANRAPEQSLAAARWLRRSLTRWWGPRG